MKPATVNLPTIWRGCDWEEIIFNWKDQDGQPINLSHWVPVASTTQFSLNARVTTPLTGETKMSLTKVQTSALKLGAYQWNWIWQNSDGSVPPPILAGSVEVKNPILAT